MKTSLLFAFLLAVRLNASPLEAALQADSDDALSLLQVSAQKHTFEEGDEESQPDLCRTGLRAGRFCCGSSCGRCGGRGCQNRPGGGNSCCTNQITRSGRRCVGRNMQNCILPRGMGRGMGMGMGMGRGMGYGIEPQVPPTDITIPSIVEELALCETSLQFNTVLHSNLGGAGPDSGSEDLVFGDVAPNTKLVVTATSAYTPNMLNPSGGVLRNGAREGFGVINMASGSSVDLTFSFVDTRDGSRKTMDNFVITFFDGDHGMAHDSRESITIKDMSSFAVDDDTSLTVLDDGGSAVAQANGAAEVTFQSTMRGSKEDNPVSPLSLSTLQARRAVAALFQDKSQFRVSLSETGYVNPQGRNIYFAGASSLICGGEAKCSTYECPLGFELRQDAEFTICDTKPCTAADHDKCCSAA